MVTAVGELDRRRRRKFREPSDVGGAVRYSLPIMSVFQYDLTELPPEAEALRAEVREFLRAELGTTPASRRAASWSGFDREFSLKVGARGWIGLTWPKRYGGH